MTHEYTLRLDDPRATLENVGGKGASLARLAVAGLPVPGGFHLTTAAYRAFVEEGRLDACIQEALAQADVSRPGTLEAASQAIVTAFMQAGVPADIAGSIAKAYAALPGESPDVAVRSSATAEDLPNLSFAGQQETYLNIDGTDQVVDAVRRCWASLWTARAIGYRMQHNVDQSSVSLAVVVQLLIPAEAAGVLFTANPSNGRRSEAVVTASWGLGEAVVGGLVTPDALVVEKATGKILSRMTADKQVMTVRTPGGTSHEPVPGEIRKTPVLSDRQAAEILALGIQIESLFGVPVDIEWALAGGKLAILQARPITALAEPELSPPSEWRLPEPRGPYMRASIVDLMPSPVSRLFATLALGAMSRQVRSVMAGVTRSEPVLPDPFFVTINDYAYLSAHYSMRGWLWMATKMLPVWPHMLRTGVANWRENGLRPYAEMARRWEGRPVAELSTGALWAGAREIVDAAMHNLAMQMVWMGAVAGSEALFTRVYDKAVRQKEDPSATTFLTGFDSIPIHAEKSLYDIAKWCGTRPALSAAVLGSPSAKLVAQVKDAGVPPQGCREDWGEFVERVRAHQDRFGHVVYDLDFATALPADDPAPMLETLKMYLQGRGTSPHERQKLLEQRRERAIETIMRRAGGIRRWAFSKALGWAQSLAMVREDALADIGLGYPVLRRILAEIGRRFVDTGLLEDAKDIFWLEEDEIEQAVRRIEAGQAMEPAAQRVRERRQFAAAARRMTPPRMLPPRKKYLGVSVDVFLPADAGRHSSDTISGAGTGAGRVTGRACVLNGPEDFDKMQPGDILVAGTTTPAWTPLFAMASAVVTDIGGPLSHGSIVAREYGIPAVMGTGVATKRIRTGQQITVDGSAGKVILTGE